MYINSYIYIYISVAYKQYIYIYMSNRQQKYNCELYFFFVNCLAC